MSEPVPPDGPTTGEPDVPEPDRPAWVLVAQFFVVPLAVVALAVGVFVAFGLFTREKRSPEQALEAVRTGSLNRRWQAAYELAADLARDPALRANERLFRESLAAFAADGTDPEVRRYLALALGRFGRSEAAPDLVRALSWPDEETRVYAALALGEIGDRGAVPALVAALGGEEATLRKVAAYALGRIGDSAAVPALAVLSEDRRLDVALQAACALAQLSSPAGIGVLRRALDRRTLEAVAEMNDDQRAEAMANAIRALVLLADVDSLERMKELGRADPSLTVRDAALRAVEKLSGG